MINDGYLIQLTTKGTYKISRFVGDWREPEEKQLATTEEFPSIEKAVIFYGGRALSEYKSKQGLVVIDRLIP